MYNAPNSARGLALYLFVMIGLTAVACQEEPAEQEGFQFGVVFDRGFNLAADDPVVYNDVTIGRVPNLTIDENTGKAVVLVSVDVKYQKLMYKEARFSIEKRPTDSATRMLVITPPADSTQLTPIEPHEILKGVSSRDSRINDAEEALENLMQGLRKAYDDLRENAK